MGLDSALVDRARVLRPGATSRKLEGRTQFVPEMQETAWFAARLFLPQSGESNDPGNARKRVVRTPTLLYGVDDDDGVEVELRASDQVEVDSEDLGAAMWQVTAQPEALRRKEGIIGWQVALRRVETEQFRPVAPPPPPVVVPVYDEIRWATDDNTETIYFTPPGTQIPTDYETTPAQWAAVSAWPIVETETWDSAETPPVYRYTIGRANITLAEVQAVFPTFALGVAPPPENLDGATRTPFDTPMSDNMLHTGPVTCLQGCPGYVPRSPA